MVKNTSRVVVLRLGHRIFRDQRTTSHCALVARAFGADEIVLCGERDEKLENNIKKVADRWGGKFEIKHEKNWKRAIEDWKHKNGVLVHLSMYGIPLRKKMKEIKKISKNKNLMIAIGSEKVPKEIYDISDFNISITNQPHSEVAALAVFLHGFFGRKGFDKKFEHANLKIIPQERGKKIIEA